jgi:hypothetical protein
MRSDILAFFDSHPVKLFKKALRDCKINPIQRRKIRWAPVKKNHMGRQPAFT